MYILKGVSEMNCSNYDFLPNLQCRMIKQTAGVKDNFIPEFAIVLGSGLGQFCESEFVNIVGEVCYSEIEGMPVSTAPNHKGKFIFAEIDGKKAIIMQGRVHLYEGYTSEQVVIPIRLMRCLGAKKLILTNAAGGINKNFSVGDFMLIRYHISCFIKSPLIGTNYDELGTRFPDMSDAYSKAFRDRIKTASCNAGIGLKEGTYVQLTGPQFETPAEIRMLSALGADAVGMSTVIEATAGVHCGFEVCGISLITNYACGILDTPLSGEEVSQTANRVSEKFEKLLRLVINSI